MVKCLYHCSQAKKQLLEI